MRSVLLPVLCLLVLGCGRAKEEARNALNKGGEIAGTAATEVIEGVTSGVQETWAVDVQLGADLKARGLSLGKVQVLADSAGRDNRVVLYCIAKDALRDTVRAIAYDQEGLEMGRAALLIDLPAQGADFLTLRFQPLTDLERKSRVVIE